MTEFRCGSCREILRLPPNAKFCSICGSTSLNPIVKEQAEPASRETIGVYTPPVEARGIVLGLVSEEEEDQPRRRRK
jgi:LSD1 subclass zinc finger protein